MTCHCRAFFLDCCCAPLFFALTVPPPAGRGALPCCLGPRCSPSHTSSERTARHQPQRLRSAAPCRAQRCGRAVGSQWAAACREGEGGDGGWQARDEARAAVGSTPGCALYRRAFPRKTQSPSVSKSRAWWPPGLCWSVGGLCRGRGLGVGSRANRKFAHPKSALNFGPHFNNFHFFSSGKRFLMWWSAGGCQDPKSPLPPPPRPRGSPAAMAGC